MQTYLHFCLEPLSQELIKFSFQMILYVPGNSDGYGRYKTSSNNIGYTNPVRREMY